MLRQSGIAEIEDMLLKIIVIGDSSVGKSNIVLRFSEDQFK
jgi:GTPase SAR1 family protein